MSTKTEERWSVIRAFPNYAVSSEGRILNMKLDHFVTPTETHSGYTQVELSQKPYRNKTIFMHRLVAMYFMENYEPGYRVTHKDGDRANNSVHNLELSNIRTRRGSEWALDYPVTS